MAINAAVVWEIRTAGATDAGAGFRSGGSGSDRSQQDSVQVNIDNATITCTTPGANSNTLTFTAGYTPTAADVGNVVYISGGTNINAGFYEITAQSSTTWTLSGAGNLTTAGGAGSTITGKMGGASSNPGRVCGGMVTGNDIYQKSGTYSITSASSNVSGGCCSPTGGSSQSNTAKWWGYNSTRGDGGTAPLLQASGISTFTLIAIPDGFDLWNVGVDGASLTSSRGIANTTGYPRVRFCYALNCTNTGLYGAGGAASLLYGCYATGCSTQAAIVQWTRSVFCVAYSNTITGFSTTGSTVMYCISVSNSGASSHGFDIGIGGTAINCTADANGGNGFNLSGASQRAQTCLFCLSTNNGQSGTGYGFQATSSLTDNAYLFNCAAYGNASGDVHSTSIPSGQQINFVSLSADPYVNRAGGNYALNSTAGGGVACRQITFAFTGVSTTSYAYIGAVGPQDPVASGTIVVNQRRRIM